MAVYRRSLTIFKSLPRVIRKSAPIFDTINRPYGEKTPKFTDGPIDPEVVFHSNLADNWWDEETVRPLHAMNEIRVPFVSNGLHQVNSKHPSDIKGLNLLDGYSILDVGCGGGIFSEALARLRADVTGLDPSHDLIKIARRHASLDQSLNDNLRYVPDSIHNFASTNENKFDAVVSSEVIEHIFNKEKFLEDCIKCVKPGGSLFLTTPNKTLLSRIFVILIAERFGIIPRGTHDYQKFISSEDLSKMLKSLGCAILRVEGCMYNAITGKFSMSSRNWLMYALHAQKIPSY